LNCRSPFTQTFRCASNTSNGAWTKLDESHCSNILK
jgi:hypothetical protein